MNIEEMLENMYQTYGNFRYILINNDDTKTGNYRVHINRKGNKIVTKNATKYISLR